MQRKKARKKNINLTNTKQLGILNYGSELLGSLIFANRVSNI